MSHTPYGYRIVNAQAIADEETAKKLKSFYSEYLRRESILAAAKAAGIEKTHSMLGKMLRNTTYLGTDFYPRLIDEETFAQVQELRAAVAQKLGRVREHTPKEHKQISYKYEVGTIEKRYPDPYEQAQYAYSQIKEEIE